MAVSRAGLALAAGLFAAALPAAAAERSRLAWMSGIGDGNASLTYGSAETGEDYVFNLICGNKDKSTEATLYDDITGNRGRATDHHRACRRNGEGPAQGQDRRPMR